MKLIEFRIYNDDPFEVMLFSKQMMQGKERRFQAVSQLLKDVSYEIAIVQREKEREESEQRDKALKGLMKEFMENKKSKLVQVFIIQKGTTLNVRIKQCICN